MSRRRLRKAISLPRYPLPRDAHTEGHRRPSLTGASRLIFGETAPSPESKAKTVSHMTSLSLCNNFLSFT